MEVYFAPFFVRKFKKFPKALQEEAHEKIGRFKSNPQDASLKVHALHGKFHGSYSFSVNYAYRIIFEYMSKTEVILLDFGDHDIYD